MADTNDRNQGSDDLFDETAPRSIFAATWFRAVLVLIVLGVIGAVAVPYILDAMNAPKPSATAKLPMPVPPRPAAAPPPPPVAVTPPAAPTAPPGAVVTTPAAPPTVAQAPSAPPPAVARPQNPLAAMDKPADTKTTDTKDTLPVPSAPSETTKPEPKAKSEPKPKPEKAPQVARTTPTPAKPTAKTTKNGGQWFVQVGAFKDAGTAHKVAAKLRDDNYKVDESPRSGAVATVAATTTAPTPSSGTGDQYDVFITGQSPAEINQRLSAKGLTAEASGNGAVVKPSLPLRDAVALSKDLAVDGLKVQVRRAGAGPAPSRSSSGAMASAGGDGLHRVSVGGFGDRATAVATLKELEAKGYKPFLTRR
jgi:cell division protein FtsN